MRRQSDIFELELTLREGNGKGREKESNLVMKIRLFRSHNIRILREIEAEPEKITTV